MIITVDGPAGSGKSTAARGLAARLGIAYLDTGAMYRAAAHAMLTRGGDPADGEALAALTKSLRIELDCGPSHTRVLADGRDVSDAIRTMAVSRVTSQVASHAAVRAVLVEEQKRIGQTLGSFVTEGRDQGTAVFPDADARFLLEASLEERAARRHLELTRGGEQVTRKEVADNLRARDQADSKHWEPLRTSGKVLIVDTSNLGIKEVVDRMVELLADRGLLSRNT